MSEDLIGADVISQSKRDPLFLLAILFLVSLFTGPTASATHQAESRFLDAADQPNVVDDVGCWEAGAVAVNGSVLSHTVHEDCGIDYNDTVWIEYDLGRDWTRFTAALGQRDDSESGHVGVFEIYADGQLLASHQIGLGTSVPVDLDVTNVLRLRLSVSGVDDGGDSCCFYAAFGSASVVRPRAHEHLRGLSLEAPSRGQVRGKLSVNDGFNDCASSMVVKIQRKEYSYYSWDTVSRTTTDSDGKFSASVPKRAHRYRAIATRTEIGVTYPEHVCLKTKSKPISPQ